MEKKSVISKEGFIQRMQADKPRLLVTMGAGDIDLLLNDCKLALTS
jgi:hypothetical protein